MNRKAKIVCLQGKISYFFSKERRWSNKAVGGIVHTAEVDLRARPRLFWGLNVMQIGNDLRESTKRGKLCKKKKSFSLSMLFVWRRARGICSTFGSISSHSRECCSQLDAFFHVNENGSACERQKLSRSPQQQQRLTIKEEKSARSWTLINCDTKNQLSSMRRGSLPSTNQASHREQHQQRKTYQVADFHS